MNTQGYLADPRRNRVVLFTTIVVIVILFVGVIIYSYIYTVRATNERMTKNTRVLYDKDGIPPSNSVLFTQEGWDKVPEFEKLNAAASEQNGGLIDKIALYRDDEKNQVFAKTKVVSDYGTMLVFLQHDQSGWYKVDSSTIPAEIQSSLNSKF